MKGGRWIWKATPFLRPNSRTTFSFFTALSLESRTPALLSPFGAVKYVSSKSGAKVLLFSDICKFFCENMLYNIKKNALFDKKALFF